MLWLRRRLPSTAGQAFWASSVVCLAGSVLFVGIFWLSGSNRSFSMYGQDGYFELATSLVRGDGFVFAPGGPPVHHRPPLYPLLLTPLVLLPSSMQVFALVVLHSLMIGCVGALVFDFARKIFSVQVARCALLVFFANPWLYSNVTNPLTPVLQCVLYAAFVYAVSVEVGVLPRMPPRSEMAGRIPTWLAIGGLGGLLSLTHGTLIAVNAAFVALLVGRAIVRSRQGAMRTAALAALVSALIVAPWTYRNWVSFNRLIPVVSGGGLMYSYQYEYLNQETLPLELEDVAPGTLEVSNSDGRLGTRFHGTSSDGVEAHLERRMLDEISERPGAFVRGLVFNATAYYFPSVAELFREPGVRRFETEKLAMTGFYALLWVLAALGVWRIRRSRTDRTASLMLVLGVLLYAVWYFPFFTSVRHTMYTFSTMPMLAILAALGTLWLVSCTVELGSFLHSDARAAERRSLHG